MSYSSRIWPNRCTSTFLAMLGLFALPAAAQNEATQRARASLEDLCKRLPELYWYASDMCLRETSQAGGQLQSKEEFVAQNKAEVQDVRREEKEGKISYVGKVKLCDPEEPKEYWTFEFVHSGQGWEASTAFKHLGNDRPMNLYEKVWYLGSMKPYVLKGLVALRDGKALSEVNWSNK